jgi:Pyridoxamine 5'-phosphate oxidase
MTSKAHRIAAVISGAPFAYLAVETQSGPHVTPLLFAFTPARVWFGIARGTLKARAIRKRPAVAVVVPGETASVAIRGEASLLDWTPSPSELARAPFALPAFAGRNALEMAAFVRDAVRSATRPSPLVPVSVTIETFKLLDGWPAPAVLGWMTPDGPLALPARWNGERGRAHVPSAPLRAAGRGRTAPACVCIDESAGLGPLAKRGRLLRGTGHARIRGDAATVELAVDRITRWKGFDTSTAPAGIS